MADRPTPLSKCIRCGAESVVEGRIVDYDPYGEGPLASTDLTFESGKHSTSISAYACPTCGHVELRVDADEICTDSLPIGCPHCGAVYGYVVTRISRNETVACQNCGQEFGLTSLDVEK